MMFAALALNSAHALARVPAQQRTQRPAAGDVRRRRQNGNPGFQPFGAFASGIFRFLERAGQLHWAKAVGRVLMTAGLRLVAWQMRRATRVMLHSLDDRTLGDIGLHRSEIDTVVGDIEWQKLRRHVPT